jgi:hypothetical protein
MKGFLEQNLSLWMMTLHARNTIPGLTSESLIPQQSLAAEFLYRIYFQCDQFVI